MHTYIFELCEGGGEGDAILYCWGKNPKDAFRSVFGEGVETGEEDATCFRITVFGGGSMTWKYKEVI